MISYHPVISEAECRDIRDKLWLLRTHWIARGDHTPSDFFTLGVAAYLDVLSSRDPEHDYYGRLQTSNSFISTHFGDLLSRIRQVLQEILGEPVAYAKDLAVPGFHIFLGEAIARSATASAHLDMQYESLRWSRSRDDVGPISLTLAIELPVSGAGLTVWPVQPHEYEVLAETNVPGCEPKFDYMEDAFYYRYLPGVLFLQQGLFLHRIAPTAELGQGDERITLQGHGMRCNGTWILYW